MDGGRGEKGGSCQAQKQFWILGSLPRAQGPEILIHISERNEDQDICVSAMTE